MAKYNTFKNCDDIPFDPLLNINSRFIRFKKRNTFLCDKPFEKKIKTIRG